MRVFRHVPATPIPSVMAIGNFDGVHRGHQAIFAECRKLAVQQKIHASCLTFEPHPREYFRGKNEALRLTPLSSKLALLEKQGLDATYLLRFDEKLAALEAADFVRNILHKKLGVRHIITGENFHFGKNRRGDRALLSTLAQALNIDYTAFSPICSAEGDAISSSLIRTALQAGEIAKANALLGRAYSISGRVAIGDKRGRELGFPTANIRLPRLSLPRFGVYAVQVKLGTELIKAIANLGIRPSFGGKIAQLEVHLFDFSRDIYGQKITVEFLRFIRPEQTFTSRDALIEQIARDIQAVGAA